MATIYEVSKLSGVSLGTVSRVINNHPSVSEKAREKVTLAIKQLDYRPNSIAQSLASNKSNCIGVLVGQFDGTFYGEMMDGIESGLRSSNKHVVFTASHCSEEAEKEAIEFLISKNCDALILYVEAVSNEYLIELNKGKTPIIILNRHITAMAEQCFSLDNVFGGYIATKAVIEKGHTDLVYISGPQKKEDTQGRLAGHQKAVKEFSISFDDTRIFEGDYLQSSAVAAIEHFIANKINFTAVICANDEMAIGAIAILRDKGFNLPQDISVMGFDNAMFSSYSYPTLSSVNFPLKEMGLMASKYILNHFYHQSTDVITNIFKPELIMRDSVIALKS